MGSTYSTLQGPPRRHLTQLYEMVVNGQWANGKPGTLP